jgi:hypothetical protein
MEEKNRFAPIATWAAIAVLISCLGLFWWLDRADPPRCKDTHSGITKGTVYDAQNGQCDGEAE